MLNDRAKKLPANHPVVMELYNPLGQLYLRKTQTRGELGVDVYKRQTTGSSAKLRPPFRPGYLIQTPPFPASFLKAVRKEPDAGTCLYDLCYLFVSGLRIKKEHTPIGTVRLQRFRRFHP